MIIYVLVFCCGLWLEVGFNTYFVYCVVTCRFYVVLDGFGGLF